ncbi:MAG: 1-acyl-sn-glycerol-3-phosphate acyltransferase [Firmicutes bacterium]|nr:1-acyl-sn-glycerol-3-phosphate acyltransferase [Bacillota bacterium]
MLIIFQLLASFVLTVLFGIKIGVDFSVIGVLSVLGIFIVNFIIVFIVIFILYVIFIYTTEKASKTNKIKHYLINSLGEYIFVMMFRVKMIVTGKENLPKDNNFVIYMNHIEYTDPIYVKIVYHKYPVAYVAKEPLFKTVLIKNVLRSIGCVSITKDADRSAMKSIIESINIVKSGQPMGIFPEGKRTYSNALIEFKPGAFKLAMKANADISPVCLYNMHGLLKKYRLRTHKIYIHILPIIPYKEYQGMDSQSLAEQVKTLINDQLIEYKKRIPEN